ncbi:major tail protein [Escherichia phage GeorgBuechner]|uniref:Major tail protein n=1 Tax=Escherichia phage GeorgBuechner TaxID=2851980 RepID=A0AAE7VSA6_9CAUD|nr:major tail protein [Escherichia phage GeorgBuechner]QXV79463.1 major tail protein [Escherichia phage GeorgBuechner]
MGYQLPNGSSVQIGSVLGAGIAVTAATNAAASISDLTKGCVITCAASHGLVVGDVVMFTKTPWVRALKRAFIVGKVAENDVTLARFDTQDVTKYPTGAFGVGTPGEVVKVSSFIDFPFITNVGVSGGDQQTTTFQPLQVNAAISLNTTKNPLVQTYTFTHDEEDPIRPILEDLDDTQKTTVIKFTNPAAASGKGEIRIYPAKVTFQKIPSAEVNNVETVQATLTLQSDMVIYRKDLVEELS